MLKTRSDIDRAIDDARALRAIAIRRVTMRCWDTFTSLWRKPSTSFLTKGERK